MNPICITNSYIYFFFFFFNDTATTEIYTLSLHDALPILGLGLRDPAVLHVAALLADDALDLAVRVALERSAATRSEEHTSELQSQSNLVCRLLLEKKKKHTTIILYGITELEQRIDKHATL